MTRDTLDDLLDSSAPVASPVARRQLDAMIADARRPTPRRLRPRILVAAGLAAFFASGGVGVATATGVFSWAPWAQQPVGAVQFSMSNGFDCEIRFSAYTAGSDPAYVAQVNRALEEWYRSDDVLPTVQKLVPAKLESLGPIELQPGETLETLPPGEAEHREWIRNWTAWDLAISDAEWQQLSSLGMPPGDPRMEGSERSGQINCLDESGNSYRPGAGS